MKDFCQSHLSTLKKTLNKVSIKEITNLIDCISENKDLNRNIYVIGNGGSYDSASHFAQDLFQFGVKAFSLSNISKMTAIANDLNFNKIFIKQIEQIAHVDDLLIIISGGGNSKNILEVLKYAKKNFIKTFCLLGFNGGKSKELCDNCIIVDSNDYGIIENVHMIICHMVAEYFFYRDKTKWGKKIK